MHDGKRRGVRPALAVIALALGLTGCASVPAFAPAATVAPHIDKALLPEDDDFTQLTAQLRSDLNRYNSREIARTAALAPAVQPAQEAQSRDRVFADRARSLFTPLSGSTLQMPVVGIRAMDLNDNWHASRGHGTRVHKGIDIFANRGTQVVAVADGIISYIGDQRLGGHCLWLTTDNGTSFFYAHLDHWAAGIYEGMDVRSGDLLGYVGNTGNALHTPPHLHFSINQNDQSVNPYPILTKALPVQRAHLHTVVSGGTYGTR